MRHATDCESARTTPDLGPGSRERGSALVIALLVVVILALLGLSFMLAGETESKIARNQRDVAQAGFVAEGGVRMVKKWFDAPAGSPRAHLVPNTGQMDRSLRWVDDDGDGTFVPYASAANAAYRVVYRQGTNDPFEKPYRGTPASTLLGNEDHPDVRISDATLAQQSFLNTLNSSLYPSFPDPAGNQTARIRQIDVYAPPILVIGGQRTRYGIATIKVIADIYQYMGTAQQTRVATRIVKAILNEAPYTNGFGGPLQSCTDIHLNGSTSEHWGPTTAVTVLDLPNNENSIATGMAYPVLNTMGKILLLDTNGDGTNDDQDSNGIADYYQWRDGPAVNDPWLTFQSEAGVSHGGNSFWTNAETPTNNFPVCTGTPCQPSPFYDSVANKIAVDNSFRDHSNVFKNVTHSLCPQYDYQFWKGVALGGGEGVYYFSSDGPGTGTYKLFGAGNSVDFRTAVDGKTGFFFFDSANNSVPKDDNSDGTFDHLADPIQLNGGGLTTGGFIYLNADLRTTGNGNVSAQRPLIAPAEPYYDANGNGKYDSDEWFIDLDYPSSGTGDYVKHDPHRVIDPAVRQDPAVDAAGGTCIASKGCWMYDINMYGVLYTNGAFDANGNWNFFGDTISKSGLSNTAAGNPGFFYDERLSKDQWPPFDLNLPRTVITAWQTDL